MPSQIEIDISKSKAAHQREIARGLVGDDVLNAARLASRKARQLLAAKAAIARAKQLIGRG